MKKQYRLFLVSFLLLGMSMFAQAASVANAKWSDVARGRCSDQNAAWWSSAEAIRIAENVLLYQREIGGWPKNTDMHKVLTDAQKESLLSTKPKNTDCTIDNGAVDYELSYLSKVYKAVADADVKAKVKAGFILGVQYLLVAQYDNGGWPQYYPLHNGYYTHITYNDDAMVHVLYILKHLFKNDGTYPITIDGDLKVKVEEAYNKGIDCILKTQYVQNGVLTAWCAQHDEVSLEPALARAYELPSISGQESAGILKLLMQIENPSQAVKKAIVAGAAWYKKVTITGRRLQSYTNSDGAKDLLVVLDPASSPLWARFYNLADNRPIFCDRDGIMKFSLAEIGYERRNGYSWYNTSGDGVATAYATWANKWHPTVLSLPTKGYHMLSTDTIMVAATYNKKTGSALNSLELILDNQTFTYSADIDTLFSGLDSGMHQLVVKASFANGATETDTAIFSVSLPTYQLWVMLGQGGGTYHANQVIDLAANPAAKGKVFSKWSGDTAYIANVHDSITTITIPNKDIQVNAVYVVAEISGFANEQTLPAGNLCYPNPFSTSLTVDLGTVGDSKIEVFDLQGKKVYSQNKTQGTHSLDVDSLTPAQYIILISNDNGERYTGKIVKR